MFFTPITEDEVIEIIKNLDAKKSPSHDHIPILIIKKLANELSTPLTYIFNLSLSSGIVPDQLKIARVVPIHKKERKEADKTRNMYQMDTQTYNYINILMADNITQNYKAANSGLHKPHWKPNDNPLYVHAGSNHPPTILKHTERQQENLKPII